MTKIDEFTVVGGDEIRLNITKIFSMIGDMLCSKNVDDNVKKLSEYQ